MQAHCRKLSETQDETVSFLHWLFYFRVIHLLKVWKYTILHLFQFHCYACFNEYQQGDDMSRTVGYGPMWQRCLLLLNPLSNVFYQHLQWISHSFYDGICLSDNNTHLYLDNNSKLFTSQWLTRATSVRSDRDFEKQQLYVLDKWGGEKIYEVISTVLSLEAKASISPQNLSTKNRKQVESSVVCGFYSITGQPKFRSPPSC